MDGKPFTRSILVVFPVRRNIFALGLLPMAFAVVFPARLAMMLTASFVTGHGYLSRSFIAQSLFGHGVVPTLAKGVAS
jgi:hypothetical protein